jgi:hypothetical protein
MKGGQCTATSDREDDMSLTRRQFLLSTSAVALTSAVARPALAQIAPSATPMQRAEELLRKMTVEEKAM